MWMIAARLEKFEMKVEIKEGTCVLTRIRLLSDNLETDSGFLYITEMGSSLIKRTNAVQTSVVIIAHGYDILFIKNSSLDEIVNEIIKIYEFYNTWEAEVHSLTLNSGTIQDIVDLSEDVFRNPMSVSRLNGEVAAYSRSYRDRTMPKHWEYVFEHDRLMLSEGPMQLKDGQGRKVKQLSSKPAIYFNDYGYSCLMADILISGELVAVFYIESFMKEMTPGDVQLAEIMVNVLTDCISVIRGDGDIWSYTSILQDLIDGRVVNKSKCEELTTFAASEGPWVLVLLVPIDSSDDRQIQGGVIAALREIKGISYALAYSDVTLCIVSQSFSESFASQVAQEMPIRWQTLCLSLPFEDWYMIRGRYRLARKAADTAGEKKICDCSHAALEYMLSGVIDDEFGGEFLHPALEKLSKYDALHSTCFYDTLYEYLRNERNLQPTSSQLCIHKNSLLYRVKRIEKIIGSYLEDPEEREYILLSYMVSKTLSARNGKKEKEAVR
jgi:hypothetical protein